MVDTIDTAQKCVTFLKEQNIGVATFIGLDKVKVLSIVFALGISVQTHSTKGAFAVFSYFYYSPKRVCT